MFLSVSGIGISCLNCFECFEYDWKFEWYCFFCVIKGDGVFIFYDFYVVYG